MDRTRSRPPPSLLRLIPTQGFEVNYFQLDERCAEGGERRLNPISGDGTTGYCDTVEFTLDNLPPQIGDRHIVEGLEMFDEMPPHLDQASGPHIAATLDQIRLQPEPNCVGKSGPFGASTFAWAAAADATARLSALKSSFSRALAKRKTG